jgi:hypothetical protein
MTEPNIMPNIEIFNPREYLADRVKRGVAFIAVLRSVGNVTEPCLSTHASEDVTEAPKQLELFED